jgi:hypothetical protein
MGATHQGRGEEALAAQDNPIFVDERDHGGNDKKLAVKLSKSEASELAAALNTLPADGPSFHPSQPATPLQPLRRRRKVKRSALCI